MKLKIFVFQVIILFTCKIIISAQVKTQSFVDKKKVYIGDIVNYHITITCPKEVTVEPFEIYEILKDTTGVENFILYNKKYNKSKSVFKKQIKHNFVFQIIPVKLGELTLGELNIQLRNIENQILPITVQAIKIEVLPYPKPKKKNFDGEIIDIKPQLWVRNFMLLLIFLIPILLILGWIFYQYRTKPTMQNYQQVQVDIRDIALDKLDKLWQKDYIPLGLIKEFYLELTEIVRWYIGEKYRINALELTTEELFTALKKIVDKKYNLELKSFLDNADLAKFAKYIPEKKQIELDFETAKRLIK